MKNIALKLHELTMLYLKWGWPLLLADVMLETWMGHPQTSWRGVINGAAFAWILCAPIAPLSFLLDRARRERAMARLCGLRDSDERERAVTGEAARVTLLLGLSLQAILLIMTMVSVRLAWDSNAPKGQKPGVLEVGMSFAASRHLDPSGTSLERPKYITFGMPPEPTRGEIPIAGGFLLAPSSFPVLALVILVQLAAFRVFAQRRYEGTDA